MTEDKPYHHLKELALLDITPRSHQEITSPETPRNLFVMVHEASALAAILIEQSMSSADTITDDELTAISVYWANFYRDALDDGNEPVAGFVKEIIFDLVLSDIPENYLTPPLEK
jgi:hypothetical protein